MKRETSSKTTDLAPTNVVNAVTENMQISKAVANVTVLDDFQIHQQSMEVMGKVLDLFFTKVKENGLNEDLTFNLSFQPLVIYCPTLCIRKK